MLSWCCDLEVPLLSPLLLILAMRVVKGLAFAEWCDVPVNVGNPRTVNAADSD